MTPASPSWADVEKFLDIEEISRADFWEAIRSGEPVSRPVDTEEATVEHDAWVIAVLVGELHMSAEEIEGLREEEGVRLVHEHWARRRQ